MSEALEKEEKQKNQAKLCIKCNAMFGNSSFEEKCSVCYKEDKKDSVGATQEDRGKQEEKGFSTPVRNSTGDEHSRRCQLIHAPKKHIHNDSEEDSDEQENDSEDLDVSQVSEKEEEDKEESVSIQLCPQQEPQEKVEASIESIDKTPRVKRELKRVIVVKREVPLCLPEPKSLKRTYQIYSSTVEQIKGRCFSCQKRTGMLGTICRHCSSQFCNPHRLPQNHSCQVDFAGDFKKKRKEELELLRPKSKGKLAPI